MFKSQWKIEINKKGKINLINMVDHWSDNLVDDIVGAFRVFVVSALVIFVALAIAKALYPSFPLNNSSSGIVAIILGIFLVLIRYIKGKNKY